MSKKISESVVQDTMRTKGIEIAPGNKGTISNSGLAENDSKKSFTEIRKEMENAKTYNELKAIANYLEDDELRTEVNTKIDKCKKDKEKIGYAWALIDPLIPEDEVEENKDLKESENLEGYNLFLRTCKYHEDELQDTDDLWYLVDRLNEMNDEDFVNECPEDFTEEDIEELREYLGHIPQEDMDKAWEDVHNVNEKCIKSEGMISPDDVVLELVLPDDVGVDLTNPEEGVEEIAQEVGNQALIELAKYVMSAVQSMKVLSHNLIGGDWFTDHNTIQDYVWYLNNMEETIIQNLVMLGEQEPTINEAIEEYPVLDVRQRNKQESFTEIKNIFNILVGLIENAKGLIPSDIQSTFENWQSYLRTEADYKIVKGLQENYMLVSNKDIKKRLMLESKIDDVKKDAEAECIRRGCDTYVYQLGEDIFYADEKPTDTRLINKGILTLGKFRIGVSDGKPVATWFEESKITSTNKKSLNELAESLQDDKTFEDPYDSDSVKEIEKDANYNEKNANVDLGGPLNDIPHEKFTGGKNPEEIDKAAVYNKEINIGDQPIVNDIHKEFKHTAMDEIKSKATYNHKELNVEGTPEGKNVEVVVTEGKGQEIIDDEDLMSLEAYKTKHKDEIDLCYKNTYGEQKIKELYDSLAEFMYSTSLTGGINNKKGYKTMNDKINETEIAGHKNKIIDNAPDGHEENQPK